MTTGPKLKSWAGQQLGGNEGRVHPENGSHRGLDAFGPINISRDSPLSKAARAQPYTFP
jgi:hypothetical protein